jgi:mono/diheme cytochrome c family protein
MEVTMDLTLESRARCGRRHRSWFARVSAIGAVTTTVLAGGSWARAGQQASPTVAPATDGATKHSVWDGVYTEDQAQRGKELYTAHCLTCHGENLEGNGPVKALSGPDFVANWNGLTMGDMLERTRTTMPMDKPGTLSRQQIADVLSFVLSVNKMPAGSTELPRQSEILSGITFLARKPSGH